MTDDVKSAVSAAVDLTDEMRQAVRESYINDSYLPTDHMQSDFNRRVLTGEFDASFVMRERFAGARAVLAHLAAQSVGVEEEAVQEECHCPEHGTRYRADGIDKMVRDIDVAINGEAGAAKQAMLCDVVGQIIENATALRQARAEIAGLRAVTARLADAADRVGVAHFDTDDMSDEVTAMQSATLEARAALGHGGREG